MSTTYLWQHRFHLAGKNNNDQKDTSQAQIQEFIESGAMNKLIDELYHTEKNIDILTQVILKYLKSLDPRKRQVIASYIYHTMAGQGILREAADMALRFVC